MAEMPRTQSCMTLNAIRMRQTCAFRHFWSMLEVGASSTSQFSAVLSRERMADRTARGKCDHTAATLSRLESLGTVRAKPGTKRVLPSGVTSRPANGLRKPTPGIIIRVSGPECLRRCQSAGGLSRVLGRGSLRHWVSSFYRWRIAGGTEACAPVQLVSARALIACASCPGSPDSNSFPVSHSFTSDGKFK